MLAGLEEWWRVTKPGGRVIFSSLGASAFQPLSDLFEQRLRDHGVTLPARTRALSEQSLTDPEECRGLLVAAEALATGRGIWIDIAAIFAMGQKRGFPG